MVYDFKTIKSKTEGLYKEKGSKFIALAYPVESIDEVNSILTELRKTYYDARHHCYAYILNPDAAIFRANDDGEPNHSAGDPILGQIRSYSITNTLVVVIRYFGGTKLGVGGLINAYKTATQDALSKAKIIKQEVLQKICFRFSYPETNEVMKLVGKFNIKIDTQLFENECSIEGKIPVRNLESLQVDVELRKNLGSEIDLKLD